MPRKKEFNLEEKFPLPQDEALVSFLRGGKELALYPGTIAKQQGDFTPFWEYTHREALIVFTRWLLESPAFEQDKERNVYLRGHARCSNVPLLLLALSGELANFFLSKKLKARSYYEPLRKPLSILNDLKNYKSELIRLGIVKNEETFDKVYVPIEKWMLKFVMRSVEKIPSYKKEELPGTLYPYFKNLTNLGNDKIYKFIFYIMKHLGLEKGDSKNISEMIRKRFERKGIKEKLVTRSLDVERLRKTLRRLIFKN